MSRQSISFQCQSSLGRRRVPNFTSSLSDSHKGCALRSKLPFWYKIWTTIRSKATQTPLIDLTSQSQSPAMQERYCATLAATDVRPVSALCSSIKPSKISTPRRCNIIPHETPWRDVLSGLIDVARSASVRRHSCVFHARRSEAGLLRWFAHMETKQMSLVCYCYVDFWLKPSALDPSGTVLPKTPSWFVSASRQIPASTSSWRL